MAHLEGYVSHIRFHNEENGYTIAVFSTQDTSVPLSARDKFWSAKKVIFIISTKASIFVRKANM